MIQPTPNLPVAAATSDGATVSPTASFDRSRLEASIPDEIDSSSTGSPNIEVDPLGRLTELRNQLTERLDATRTELAQLVEGKATPEEFAAFQLQRSGELLKMQVAIQEAAYELTLVTKLAEHTTASTRAAAQANV